MADRDDRNRISSLISSVQAGRTSCTHRLRLTVSRSASAYLVVLRLRGKEDLGNTYINTIVRYHDALAAAGSHLVLAGISERVLDQLTNTEALQRLGADNVFPATHEVGQSLQTGLERCARHAG